MIQIWTEGGQWEPMEERTITEKLLDEAAVRKAWDGSQHYKTGGVECVDLYRAGGMFRDWAMASIIKYAFRCRREYQREPAMVVQDMRKIIDIANKMIASFEVEE